MSFQCGECGYGPAPVKWPADARLIEAALFPRPVNNRNWVLGETVLDLQRENREHGL
jgi:hypothetical protein